MRSLWKLKYVRLKIVEVSIQHLHVEGIISVLFYSFTVLSQKQVIATQLPAKMEARAQKQTLVLNASVHHSGTV